MRKLLKTELIKHLDELAFLGEMLDWNTFKVRAYRSAIDALEAVEDDELPGRVQDKSLLEIKGIGKGILAIAQSVAAKGTSDEFVAASSELPLSLLELRGLSGLGPKKIRVLHDEIGVTNLGELEYACEENRLVNLKGFGAKTQEKIREQIQTLKSNQGKFILSDALEFTDHFVKKAGAKTPLIPVGEVATKEPIVHVLDFLLIKTAKLAKENAEKEEAYLRKLAGAPSTKESADRLIEMKTKEGVQIRFEVCDSKVAGVRQVVRTSSESHWKSLEKKAASLNINLETLHCTSDVVLYEKLALPFYHPEERSQPARSDHRSLKVSDLTGVFHLHTTESDGVNTLQEMAEAAYERGWKFMGLSDHSQSAVYAHGLKSEDLKTQTKNVEALEKQLKGFRIFRGVESDILKDGSLDYPVSVLKTLDFVIASIHSRFGMKEMTERLIRAIENPFTTMIGHLTGRLLLAREGYALDYEKVVNTAVAHGKIIELNAHPHRLDIDWKELSKACKQGLLISINPDAHSVRGFDAVQYGIWMARKAGVPKAQIFNTWPLEKIEKFLSDLRHQKVA